MKPKSEQFVNGRLQWIPPKSLLVDEKLKNMLQYRISVIDIYNNTLRMIDYNPHKHDGKSMSNNVSLKIKDLRPFTHYRFNISCKIDDSQNPYWSDMISVDILTEPKSIVLSKFELQFEFNGIFFSFLPLMNNDN